MGMTHLKIQNKVRTVQKCMKEDCKYKRIIIIIVPDQL